MENTIDRSTVAMTMNPSRTSQPIQQRSLALLSLCFSSTMAGKGGLTYTPGKPSQTQFALLVACLVAYSLAGGWFAGKQPAGQWRYFSWHPLLMTCGMVGFAGVGAVIKKMGGYTNTKLHAVFGFLSIICNVAGLWIIFNNKEVNGYDHLKTAHSKIGIVVVVACMGLGMAGSAFLHPDWGVDKTNKTIRFWHKNASRVALLASWFTATLGLLQLVPKDPVSVAIYGAPLLCFVPFVLM